MKCLTMIQFKTLPIGTEIYHSKDGKEFEKYSIDRFNVYGEVEASRIFLSKKTGKQTLSHAQIGRANINAWYIF